MPDLLIKHPDEVRTYTFRFHRLPEIQQGEMIASVTGITASPSGDLSIGTGTIVPVTENSVTYPAAGVQATISAGIQGKTYNLVCEVVTSAGHTLDCVGNLQVSARPL